MLAKQKTEQWKKNWKSYSRIEDVGFTLLTVAYHVVREIEIQSLQNKIPSGTIVHTKLGMNALFY